MRRLLRIRLLVVLAALLVVPAIVLPFAERLRTEWARYWEPKVDLREAANEERERVRLAERALQAIMADPSYGDSAVVVRSLWGDLILLSEDELRELRNRQLALDVADACIDCSFEQVADEDLDLAQDAGH